MKARSRATAAGRPRRSHSSRTRRRACRCSTTGVRITPGQEILATEHDHYVHHEAIRLATEKNGASFRQIALHERAAQANAAEMVERLRRAITPKTRVVGLTLGPLEHRAAAADPRRSPRSCRRPTQGRSEADRCLLILDGVHGFGCSDEDVAALGADFVAASTHKWIFGPRGTGLVWGRADAWPHIRPTVPTFDSLVPIGRWMADQPPDPQHAGGVRLARRLLRVRALLGGRGGLRAARAAGTRARDGARGRAQRPLLQRACGHEERHAPHAARPEAARRHRLLRGEGPEDRRRQSRGSRRSRIVASALALRRELRPGRARGS